MLIHHFWIVKFFDFIVEKLSSPSPSESVNSMRTSDIVLVAGATGGVGRRVVDILRKKGIPVRVLVLLLTYLPHKNSLQIYILDKRIPIKKIKEKVLEFLIYYLLNSMHNKYWISVSIFTRLEMKRRQERC